MTEAEWQVSEKPWEMLAFVLRKRGRVSQRQLRLYAMACVRRVWSVLDHDGSRGAVAVAERYADGTATRQEVDRAWGAAEAAWLKHDRAGNCAAIQAAVAAKEACRAAKTTADRVMFAAAAVEYANPLDGNARSAELRHEADLVRDIIGNPLRPAAMDPRSLTPTVVGLAEAIDAERAFDRLPALADALEEAGCDCADILSHCRADGPHVRGCRVVELVLGKH